ncbi:imidazole glycerol phosphate synthase cyclase subunit [Streptomyces massasporeus]|uniref:imidazole glycerol phosphate synthase subunit HisF n=1 Tax=Streptomyces massasporeus TaxID=67324 RepID=UPI0033C1F35F
MLTARLIACFDVVEGRVTKARRFLDNIDVGDAAEIAASVYADGIDEVIFYDILASAQRRRADLRTIEAVASQVFVPLTVGGGIRSLRDMHAVLDAGAEKISLDSMAVRDPDIITQGSKEFGRQCIVQSMQVKRVQATPAIPSGYEVMIDGARVATGLDAVAWARRGEDLGAGEIVVNSIDQDGTHQGYDLDITKAVAQAVNLPVVASGGAGSAAHAAAAFQQAGVSAAIISSLLYSPRMERTLSVREVKDELTKGYDLLVRPCP